MTRTEAMEFCNGWLGAWTGNQPSLLIEFYHKDCLYRDPAIPEGLKGKDELFAYLRKLLAKNPQWVWKADDVFSFEGGFALRWNATIPLGKAVVHEQGLDLVFIKNGLISRNEVYFDRTALLRAMKVL